MAHRIRLLRYEVENIQWQYYGAYRMRVRVADVEGDGLDKNIFVYKRNPINPYTGEYCDVFETIAGPAQLADYPAGAPDVEHGYPYYRLDYFELDFGAESLALEMWNIILKEAAILCQAMAKYEQLSVVEDVWTPSFPSTDTDSSTASESESTSESTSEA